MYNYRLVKSKFNWYLKLNGKTVASFSEKTGKMYGGTIFFPVLLNRIAAIGRRDYTC